MSAVTKEVLSGRTGDYQGWVAAFARNHALPLSARRTHYNSQAPMAGVTTRTLITTYWRKRSVSCPSGPQPR
jgi:hypothetical protein